jgi:hypothetical protein
LFSIEDLSVDKQYERSIKDLLNSPRTLEACKRLGIHPEELDPVTEDVVRERIMTRERKKTVPKVLVDMRMQYYQDKRTAKIN